MKDSMFEDFAGLIKFRSMDNIGISAIKPKLSLDEFQFFQKSPPKYEDLKRKDEDYSRILTANESFEKTPDSKKEEQQFPFNSDSWNFNQLEMALQQEEDRLSAGINSLSKLLINNRSL
jgi:hypothetical protein